MAPVAPFLFVFGFCRPFGGCSSSSLVLSVVPTRERASSVSSVCGEVSDLHTSSAAPTAIRTRSTVSNACSHVKLSIRQHRGRQYPVCIVTAERPLVSPRVACACQLEAHRPVAKLGVVCQARRRNKIPRSWLQDVPEYLPHVCDAEEQLPQVQAVLLPAAFPLRLPIPLAAPSLDLLHYCGEGGRGRAHPLTAGWWEEPLPHGFQIIGAQGLGQHLVDEGSQGVMQHSQGSCPPRPSYRLVVAGPTQGQ